MQTGGIKIEHRFDGDAVTLTVTGEIDALTVADFKEAVQTHLERGCKRLLIDVRGVPYADSSCLQVLIYALRHLRDRGGIVGLIGCSPTFLRILAINQLDRYFTLFTSAENGEMNERQGVPGS